MASTAAAGPGVGPEPPLPWHALELEAVARALDTDAERGLTEAEAARRLAAHGPNESAPPRRRGALVVLAAQFRNAMIAILLAALVPTVFLGHAVEAVTIAVIVAASVLLGFLQEWRAERALEALQRMAAPTGTVVRGGAARVLAAREIVPGDVLLLREGDRVPADARLVEAANLRAAEAALTGESAPVDKHPAALAAPALPLGDRSNLVHAGTSVTSGRGRALVVATGPRTEFGRVAHLLERVEPARTPLQRDLARLGGALARAALAIVAVVFGLGLVRGEPLLEMFLTGVALAVAVVPEALPAIVTVSLALGVQRMASRRALVRQLAAVETLGSITVICADKTGTLTRNEMTVRAIRQGGRELEVTGAGYDPRGDFVAAGRPVAPDPALRELLTAAALCNDARLEPFEGGAPRLVGDPTEGALVVAAAKAGLARDALERAYPRTDELPFSSEAKRMTTLHRGPRGGVAFAKGAPEVLVPLCSALRTEAGREPLGDEGRAAALAHARALAAEGLRVIAVAGRPAETLAEAGDDLTLLGLLGLLDPPRSEARGAVETCRSAGIRPLMITGDHPLTARAVARELGLCGDGRVVGGAELDELDEASLEKLAACVDVYARVSPEHKLRLVRALQSRGDVVAMTGDGVNDAPALKRADIGVAMGQTGTDVSREAAAMTLLDDDFATIVAAVEEGRGIFANIRKYLSYLLSSNLGEIVLVAATALLGLPLPLTAAQILYVNLATDGLPALALAADPHEADLMRRRPRDAKAGLLTRPVLALIVVGGLWSAGANVAIFAGALADGRSPAEARSLTFVSLILIQLVKAYNFRSDRASVLRLPFANRWLDLAVLWELALLVAVVNVPFLQRALGTAALSASDWAIVAGAAVSIAPVLEAAKWAVRRGWLGRLEGPGRAREPGNL
jgi:Ca2+-transporting ATPase